MKPDDAAVKLAQRILKIRNELKTCLSEREGKVLFDEWRHITSISHDSVPTLARALIALSTPPAPAGDGEQWQSIHTAPKDGTEILIGCNWEPLAVVGSWVDGEWLVKWDGSKFEPGFEATHWRSIVPMPDESRT